MPDYKLPSPNPVSKNGLGTGFLRDRGMPNTHALPDGEVNRPRPDPDEPMPTGETRNELAVDRHGEDFASAYGSYRSLRGSTFHARRVEASPLRIQQRPSLAPGRTPIPSRPLILRSTPKQASAPLTQEQTTYLLRSLTQRDVCILQSLYDYRYLTTLQLQRLFFPSIRSAQLRLQYLKDHGLVYRWKMIGPPGVTRRPSLFLITPRGARLLADVRGDSPWDYIRRAKDARDHCWHVVHDLEANGFFIDLIVASRLALHQGLLRWVGEEGCRANRRAWAKEHRKPIATPDGMGVYLYDGSTIRFDLEWDRGTASLSRLRQKVRTHASYWRPTNYWGATNAAQGHHVLFVVPHQAREKALHPIIRAAVPDCHFWTTTSHILKAEGPLGWVWSDPQQAWEARGDPSPLADGWPGTTQAYRPRCL